MGCATEPGPRWGLAATWFAASAASTFVALLLAGTNANLLMRSASDPAFSNVNGAVALFVVLMAPSTVRVGTVAARRHRRLPRAAAAFVAANVLLATYATVDASRPGISPVEPVPPPVEEAAAEHPTRE